MPGLYIFPLLSIFYFPFSAFEASTHFLYFLLSTLYSQRGPCTFQRFTIYDYDTCLLARSIPSSRVVKYHVPKLLEILLALVLEDQVYIDEIIWKEDARSPGLDIQSEVTLFKHCANMDTGLLLQTREHIVH